MNPFIQTCLLLLVSLAISNTMLANDGRTVPSTFTSPRFMSSVKTFDSIVTATASAKVCACQILNLRSNNHHLKNAVVFAEKTNSDKHTDTDLAKAKIRLEKEKRLMRILFYTQIEVVAKTTAPTDCNTLFMQLKKKQANLLLYEVLDADVAVK